MGWILDRLPASRAGRAALAFFLVASITLSLAGRGERSGFTVLTTPGPALNGTNPLLGYTTVLDGAPLHRENAPFMNQALMYGGTWATLDFYALRGFNPFVASLLLPLLDVGNALAFTNWVAWAVVAWASWRFARRLGGDDRAALLASALASTGLGMVVMANDLSAHLPAYAFSFGLVVAVHESEVFREERPLRTHLLLGVALALACLNYNSGLFLVAGYLAVALRRNRWWHVALAAALPLVAQRAWHVQLNLLNGWINEKPWTDFGEVERSYLRRSLEGWRAALEGGPGTFARTLLRQVVSFLPFESPLVLAGGLAASAWLLRTRRELAWFFLAFVAPAFGAGLLYAQAATARGYLVYGTALFLYAPLGIALARLLRGRARRVGMVATVLVLATHLAWNGEHLRGRFGPAMLYAFGTNVPARLVLARPEAMSLTGAEPTPVLFGGGATLREAGVLESAGEPLEIRASLVHALGARAFHAAWLLALAGVLAVGWRQRLEWWGAGLVLLALSTQATARALHRRPAYLDVGCALTVPPRERLRYAVEVSPAFVDALARAEGTTLEVLVIAAPLGVTTPPGEAPPAPRVTLRVGDRAIALRRSVMTTFEGDRALALEALRATRRVEVEIAADDHPVAVGGWQRRGLPGRTLAGTFEERTGALPALELRARAPDGVLVLAGF